MKIYILTYTNKTFLSKDKIHSGIDMAALTQLKVLKELGHHVRMFAAQTDLEDELIDFFINYKEQDAKVFAKKNKNSIELKMLECIHNFNPDVILSNFYFGDFYKKLMQFKKPIIYLLHSKPGFFTDFLNANLLHEMCTLGHTFACVSEYHKEAILKYYRKSRSIWEFDEIIPDAVIAPQCVFEVKKAKDSDGFIRHCSAANKEKDTFLLLEVKDQKEDKIQIFTTLNYLSKDKEDKYIDNAISNHSSFINLDVKHSDMMEEISKSEAVFVGNASYDTFTITSLEALSSGVPLFVKDRSGHPATEMLPQELVSKYITLIKNKKDLQEKIDKYKDLTLENRNEIIVGINSVLGIDSFKVKLEEVILNCVTKYNSVEQKDEDLW